MSERLPWGRTTAAVWGAGGGVGTDGGVMIWADVRAARSGDIGAVGADAVAAVGAVLVADAAVIVVTAAAVLGTANGSVRLSAKASFLSATELQGRLQLL